MNERMTAFKPIPMLNNLYEISEDGEKFYYVGTGIIRKLGCVGKIEKTKNISKSLIKFQSCP